MRSFLYGRYDVLQDARGYMVFKHDREIPREIVRELTPCFSSEDPDYKILQNLGGFHVYFPLHDGLWVFGSGKIEGRGNYYSYILHGVLLDDAERRALGYNPFLIAAYLKPDIGDLRELPSLPPAVPVDSPEQTEKAIVRAVDDCLALPKSGLWLHIAGDIATRLLERKVTLTNDALSYRYNAHLPEALWRLVYHLLPEHERRRTSLCSLAPFLKRSTHLAGGFEPQPKARGRELWLSFDRPEPTVYGTFLAGLIPLGLDQRNERIRLLSAAFADASRWAHAGAAVDSPRDAFAYITDVLRGVEKPSPQSLEHWGRVPALGNIFPYKARHYLRVWRRHRADARRWFPRLGETLIRDLQRDFDGFAADGLPDHLQKAMDRVIVELGATASKDLARYLLGSPALAARYLAQVHDRTISDALWAGRLDAAAFTRHLQNRLDAKPSWSEDLDDLFGHKHFYKLGPRLLARIFDLIHSRDTRYFIDHALNHHFIDHPRDLRFFLDSLEKQKLFLGRFIESIRQNLIRHRANRTRSDNFLQLLGICGEVDEAKLKDQARRWIRRRPCLHIFPALARSPQLSFFVEIWSKELEKEGPQQELAWLRLAWLVLKKRAGKGMETLSDKALAKKIRGNKLFEILLKVS